MIDCHIYTLRRNGPESRVELFKPRENVGRDPAVLALLDTLQNKLRSTQQKRTGRIDPEAEANGNASITALRAWQDDSGHFDDLSSAVAAAFEKGLEGWDDAFAGHLVVATQIMFEQRWAWVYWLQQKETFEADDQGQLRRVFAVDTGQLRFAASVQVSTWAKDPAAFPLTLVTARGVTELTTCFENTFALTDEQDKTGDTDRFLQVVEDYAELLEDDAAASDTRKEVVNYCLSKAKSGEEADIQELSGQLNPEKPEAFASFVYEHDNTSLPPNNPDAKALKDYVRFAGRDKDLAISFSSHLIGHGIAYEPDNNRLVLEHLPQALRDQLERHLSR